MVSGKDAVTVCCACVLQLARQLRFVKWMSRFSKTLSGAAWPLLGCCAVFTHLTVAYAGLGFLVSGAFFFSLLQKASLSGVGKKQP